MKKSKVLKPTHKQKDKAMTQLLGFITELRRNDIDQAMLNYFLTEVKKNENFKFDKPTRNSFFYWLRRDEEELKEIWTNCAFKVYKDIHLCKELINIFFDDYIDTMEKQWDKTNFSAINKSLKSFKKVKA